MGIETAAAGCLQANEFFHEKIDPLLIVGIAKRAGNIIELEVVDEIKFSEHTRRQKVRIVLDGRCNTPCTDKD